MTYTYQQINSIIAESIDNEDVAGLDVLLNELFEPSASGSTPFSPALRIAPEAMTLEANEDESALALNILNRISRGVRLIKFRAQMERQPASPVIVSEGDSWFQYPIRLEDIIDVLIDRQKYAIFSIGSAGDTISQMIRSGEYLAAISEKNPKCFLFSGGGNDLLGDGKLSTILRPFTNNASAGDLIDDNSFGDILDQVIDDYRTLLQTVAQRAPHLPVLAHGYDHPGNVKEGPWIWPHMQAKGISEPLAKEIIAILLDRFGAELDALTNQFDNFKHISVIGVVGNSNNSWFDALHPRDAGYKRVAGRFEIAIDSVLQHQASPTEAFLEARIPLPAGHRRTAAESLREVSSANEAIIRHMYLPDCYDIGDIEFGPSSTWRRFRDPKVHNQIRDVLKLLRDRDEPELPGRVIARVETRPEFANSFDASVEEFEVTDDLVERIIHGNDLEPIQTLLSAYGQSRAIGLVQIMSPHGTLVGRGTGFIVGQGLLLTNNHVLRNADVAARSFVVFDNEITMQGERLVPQRFRLTPDIYFTSADFDFSFASVELVNRSGKHLSDYGHLPLIRESGKALKREPVSIVQHPGGRPKMIAIRNSYIMGRVNEGIYYTTDTEGGSSGSPVFNRESQVVALHHRTVPHPHNRGEFLANRGIRISSVFDSVFQFAQSGNSMASAVLRLIAPSGRANLPASLVASPGYGETYDQEPESDYELTTCSVAGSDQGGVVESGAYQDLSEEELLEAIGLQYGSESGDEFALWERTAPDDDEDFELFTGDDLLEDLSTEPHDVLRMIGERGTKFIIAHEVSSRRHYERRLKNPVLPGGSSGITIGIGYDLGHHSLAEFRRHWAGLLSNSDQSNLERCIGWTGSRARTVLASVRHITIEFDTALTVFKRSTLPKYFALLDRHIDDNVLQNLHPDCVAALVSLTFNRGPSFGRSGDRFREMRAIKRDLNNGRPERVPGHLRSMKRLWRGRPNLRGLLRRRDEEARLFQDGLDQQNESNEFASMTGRSSDAQLASFGASYYDPVPGPSPRTDATIIEARADETAQIDSLTLIYSTPDGDEMSELDRLDELSAEEASRPRIGWGDVGWVNTFSNNPDYWHLPAGTSGRAFDLTSELIEQAIRLGHYEPRFSNDGKLILAIRGARLASGQMNERASTSIRVVEQKPNHRHFRCVIASYDRNTRRISAFRASTVPNRGGVASQYNKANGHGGTNANMLPTGCYDLCVGTHHGSTTVPNVLRLGTGPSVSDALRVTTLRTINDGVYGTADFWDNSVPKDNVHPAFSASSADFSSLGCLTVPGTFGSGGHRGQWALFRTDAGFDGSNARGKRYNLLLTTGMECAAIAAAVGNGNPADLDQLKRLSHGSRGQPTRDLQAALSTAVDGVFGPGTKKSLTEFERQQLNGVATGIYSMRSQQQIGQIVF